MLICETFKPTTYFLREAVGWFYGDRYYCIDHLKEIHSGAYVRHFSLYTDYLFVRSNKYLTKEYINEYLQNLQSE